MKKQSFLVVESNIIAQRELSDILRYLGYKNVCVAENGIKAFTLIKNEPFDCVIAAWDMPEMSGPALLKVIRHEDEFDEVPFFLTDDAFTKEKVITAGRYAVTGLIVKPFNVETVKEKVDSLAEINQLSITSDVQASFNDAMNLLEAEEYTQALELFEGLLAEGETPELYFNIGYIKTVQNDYAGAIEAFRKATQLNNLYAKAFEAMGRAYKALGDSKEAEVSLNKAAEIYLERDREEKAEEILHEIVQETPETINVYNTLGVIYRKKGDYQTALLQYQKALKIHPDEPLIYYNIGRLYVNMKDLKQAAAAFKDALQQDPEFKEAQEALTAIDLGLM